MNGKIALIGTWKMSAAGLYEAKELLLGGASAGDAVVHAMIAAVRSAIDNTGKLILQDHLKHCIVDAAREGDQEAIDDLCQAIDKYMK